MKHKLINFLLLTFFLFLISYHFSFVANAQIPTSSVSKEELEKMKTNIASITAQKKLVERREIVGKVTNVSNTQITLEDLKGNTRFADVDELTKFSSPSQKGSFGISDINKGTTLGVLGLYNKESRRILSRFVNVILLPKFIHAVVTSSDSQNYAIAIKTEKNKFNVDVETTTKTLSFSKSAGLLRTGFSKIKEGQNIIVVGFPDTKDPTHIIASRIIIFPDIPQNPNINAVALPQSPSITPSTGSGKKLTPIIK